MSKTEIMLHDEWKAVRIDAQNWQVYQLREIKDSKRKDRPSRAGEVDWVGLPAYFFTLSAAAGYVYDKLADKAGKKSIKELIDFLTAERAKMVKAVKAVER